MDAEPAQVEHHGVEHAHVGLAGVAAPGTDLTQLQGAPEQALPDAMGAKRMEGVKVRFKLKVLTDDQVEEIHDATLKILERTGVRFDSEKVRKRLIKAGGTPHSTRKNVLTFQRSMVEESIKKIPKYAKYFARDPKNGPRMPRGNCSERLRKRAKRARSEPKASGVDEEDESIS